jgi:hypothetical protein
MLIGQTIRTPTSSDSPIRTTSDTIMAVSRRK